MKKRQLISVADFSVSEIEGVYELAGKIKKNPSRYQTALQGQAFGLIFEKPSTRTWISFESGIFALGGGTIYLGPSDIKLGAREEVRDVARVLNRYLAGVILRTFHHETITEFGRYFTRPMINGLSDQEHPCQALADIFTIREKWGKKTRPKVAFVGDGNNVLNSLILLTAKLGGELSFATPKKHGPSVSVLRQAKKTAKRTRAVICAFEDPKEAVKDADVVYTDVWVSMGQEKQRAKKVKAFKSYQLNKRLFKAGQEKGLCDALFARTSGRGNYQ